MTVTGLRLDVDLDRLPWIIGPTEQRPLEEWLPEAVTLMKEVFGVGRKQLEVENYLAAMLERIGREEDERLPYQLIRWLDLRELPFVASFGMAERAGDEMIEEFLRSSDLGPVEPPVVEQLPAPAGSSIRRAITYSQPDAGVFVEVRYVVDTGHPEAVALLHAGSRSPAEVMAALEDLDAAAATLRVSSAA